MLWSKVIGTGEHKPSDPYFSNVSLLLFGEGVSGSTNIIDSSNNAYSLTRSGAVQISTSVKEYGSGSIRFNGTTGDALVHNSPPVSLVDWYSSDYTIEAWVYADSFTSWGLSIPVLVGHKNLNDFTNNWSFGPIGDGSNRLVFFYYNGIENRVYSTVALQTSAWNHVAMTNQSGMIRVYVNGIGTAAVPVSGIPTTGTATFSVNGYNNNYLTGYVDNLRITKGVARYTSNFVPSANFPDQ